MQFVEHKKREEEICTRLVGGQMFFQPDTREAAFTVRVFIPVFPAVGVVRLLGADLM